MGSRDRPSSSDGGPRLVLHLLPSDRQRGAQSLARVVIEQLDGHPDHHEALTLFRAPPGLLRPEGCLDVAPERRRFAGVVPVAAWRLRRHIRRSRPAAVISHGGEILPYLPLAVPRSVATVYYRVGTANEHLRSRARRVVYRWLVGRCRAVVAISADAAAEAVELYGDRWRTAPIIPNARDPERFRPADRTASGDGDAIALFVGDISVGKGADRFVHAIARLRSEGVPVRGVMAGAGPLREALGEEAARAGVDLLGHVDDIPALMAEADLFVFPSVDREGMPGVLVEAALCGLPCVASLVPGVVAVVDDGQTGYVVAAGDDGALADRVRDLVADAELRRRLGREARHRAVARFSHRAVGEQWQALLLSLLGPPPVPASPAPDR